MLVRPKTTSVLNATCQLYRSVCQAPIGALTHAISPNPVSAFDMTRAPRSGLYKSRTMARPHITTAPIAAPCTLRQKIKISIDEASTQNTAANE